MFAPYFYRLHACLRPKKNISVTASNQVSSAMYTVHVEVLYRINGISFDVGSTLANTTNAVEFQVSVPSSADVPMNDVNITINYNHGVGDVASKPFYTNASLPAHYSYQHLFDMPGEYTVEANFRNIIDNQSKFLHMSVWDSLLDLDFVYYNGSGKYITNTSAYFHFTGVPPYGFKYSIDFDDGTVVEDLSDAILYNHYNLSVFSHIYTKAGVYTVRWKAANGYPGYNMSNTVHVLVQNMVPYEGYIVQPYGQKYPWLNLQTLPISVNITLNDSMPLPTNATCEFNADDGTSLVFLNYSSRSVEHFHRYLKEGTFNTTMNCSNEVSHHTHEFLLTVEKYQASYLTVVYEEVVPLNKSDSVTVYFHIDSGGFALIPQDVTLNWNYDAANLTVNETTSVTYNQSPYSYTYHARGDYEFTLEVFAGSTQTSSFLTYPLRLGIMRFEYNSTIAFINTTVIRYIMYGVGGLTNYTLFYGDGTADGICSSTGSQSCHLDHKCPSYGFKLVHAQASNGTFVELDDVNITCDNPMDNLTTNIPTNVVLPDGVIHALLTLAEGNLPLPLVNCEWNMGDAIQRESIFVTESDIDYTNPFNFTFRYIPIGRALIKITCWNLINVTHFNQSIKVTNEDFLFTGVFDRFYSQSYAPLLLSSMLDTEIFSRLEILANSSTKTHFNQWSYELFKSNDEKNLSDSNRQGLIIARLDFLQEKKYEVKLTIGFLEESNNFLYEPTYIQLVMPPPHAMIVGDRRRLVNRGSVDVNAHELSYDPVFPDDKGSLTFGWNCAR